jgi:Ca2+-transporting ATPase
MLAQCTLLWCNSEGVTQHILANEVVPGDLVKFTTGDRIPADTRLIDSVDLEVDESSLTGEPDARRKDPTVCRYENNSPVGDPVALAERSCIVFMGTLVWNGMFFYRIIKRRGRF